MFLQSLLDNCAALEVLICFGHGVRFIYTSKRIVKV